jgi:hypothetical protein
MKDRLQRILQNLVQVTPAELDACEVCRKQSCSQDEWINCDSRTAHVQCLEKSTASTNRA